MSEVIRDKLLACFKCEAARAYAHIAFDATMRGAHYTANGFWVTAYNTEKEFRDSAEEVKSHA